MFDKFGFETDLLATLPPAKQRRQAGFSLIEIMVVMALVGGLLAVIVGNVLTASKNAKAKETELGFGQLRSAIQMYKLGTNKIPTTEQGLKALVENPGIPGWRGPYCEPNLLKDAWGNDIQYESDGHKMRFASSGDDEQFGTDDDVVWPEPEQTKTASD